MQSSKNVVATGFFMTGWRSTAMMGLLLLCGAAQAGTPVFKTITSYTAGARHAACAAAAGPCIKPDLTPAAGIVADGAAVVFVVVQTDTAPASATLTTTNESTLVPYDPNYGTYPPTAGSSSLTVSGDQIVEYESGVYILATLQAPDIVQPGADGGSPDYTVPVSTTVTLPGYSPSTLQLQLYPPPVLFIHGLWGQASSLANVATKLSKQSPWQGIPSAFLTKFAYMNDAAFDSSTVETSVSTAINQISNTLSNDQIAVARVDVVAHSMGGLVARHYTGVSGYTNSSNRTLGLFHQIVTINTPEAGSLLATFLINNQAATFSPNAGTIAQKVKASACPDATTVADCFAAAGENLAPPGQPVTSGAVFSLEPDSPNIASLPSASIPNGSWNASSSNVSQNDNLMFGTNALVFELDELIAATCPGASYCPTAKSKIPNIGSILTDKVNDGIVTVVSQISGCTSPCQSATFKGLAHSKPADAGAFGNFVLSFKNVLDNASVDGFVSCKLAHTACADASPGLAAGETRRVNDSPPNEDSAGNPDLRYPGRVPELVKRLSIVAPAVVTMGESFDVKVKAPLAKVRNVTVRQTDEMGNHVSVSAVLSSGADGQTIATVTPLLMGNVHIIVNASFTDYAFSAEAIALKIAPPTRAPLSFSVDEARQENGATGPIVLHAGQTLALDPSIRLQGAPDTVVKLAGRVVFRAIQNQAQPVVAIHQDGSFTGLRDGTATLEADFAGFKTTVDVEVNRAKPLLFQR